MLIVTEVDTGETLDLLTAIKWVHELDLDGVDFEVDSKSIADDVNSQQQNLSEFNKIIPY